MKFTATSIQLNNGSLVLPVPKTDLWQVNDVIKAIKDGKAMTVEICQKRQKRSLDANAYLWALITEIAAVLRSSKDEIYNEMILRYGTILTHIIVKPEAVGKFIAEWHGPVRVLGTVKAEGQHGIQNGVQLQCFAGSSSYDSKQFSRLLDGVVDEAKALGIETLDEIDRKKLIEEWGR